jgi:hypothetical protein
VQRGLPFFTVCRDSLFDMSSSRKPAVPQVATYRILTQLGEYRGWF